MEESKPNKVVRGSLKVTPDIADWVYEQQEKARRLSGKRPTVSEVLRSAIEPLKSIPNNTPGTSALLPASASDASSTGNLDPHVTALTSLLVRAVEDKGNEIAAIAVSMLEIYGRETQGNTADAAGDKAGDDGQRKGPGTGGIRAPGPPKRPTRPGGKTQSG